MDVFAIVQIGDVVSLQLALQADPAVAKATNADGASLLSFAAYSGKSAAVTAIRAALPELTPYEACIVGDEAELRRALAAGWDPDTRAPDGFTPLALCAFFSQKAAFDLLLPLTKDIDARATNAQQVAALHAAAAARATGAVSQLVRAGADPDLPQQHGFRALHTAAINGDTAIAGLLILAGADPALKTDGGETAADLARKGKHDWLAQRLAALGG